MKRFLFSALVYLFFVFPSLANAQTNTVSLSTYYPSPFGAYDRLRLVPRTDLVAGDCTAAQEGLLYIPTSNKIIQQCTLTGWRPLAGGVWKKVGIAGGANYFDNLPAPATAIDLYSPVDQYNNLTALQPYVGIGTDNPLRPLHIAIDNPKLESVLVLENKDDDTSVNHNSGTGISFRGNSVGAGGGPFTEMAAIHAVYNIEPPKVESMLEFYVRNGVTGNNIRLVSLSGFQNGLMGIRTANPDAILSIATNASTAQRAFSISTSAVAPASDLFTILANGRVGIGQANPTEKLHVNGNIKADNLILTSDAVLKKDIVPVKNSLDKISRLKGVSFEWKNNATDQRKHMGVLAQDVEKIFPEAVYGKDGAKGVDYPSLIAPLIEAVKELKTKNELLSNQLNDQAGQIREQQKTIESLQSAFTAKDPITTP